MLEAVALALNIGSSLYSGIAGSRAAAANRRAANRAAGDVLRQGEFDVMQYRRQLAQLMGTQRTNAAAQGLDVEQGSAAEIRRQTEAFGEEDVATIRRNAAQTAWGIRATGNIQSRSAQAQAFGQIGQAAGTLLGAAPGAWSWYTGVRDRARQGKAVADYVTANGGLRF